MSKHKNRHPQPGSRAPAQGQKPRKGPLASILGTLLFAGVIVAILWTVKQMSPRSPSSAATSTTPVATQASAPVSSNLPQSRDRQGAAYPEPKAIESSATPSPANTNVPGLQKAPDLSKVEINQAIMVTVELDFGPTIPSIADALNFIERRSKADDGSTGRTFAILDAYGEPTPDKKKLHISMHVSTEKPGRASLVFSKTGEVIWQTTVQSTTNAPTFTGKNLTVLLDTGTGTNKAWMLDGSAGPPSILDAVVRDLGKPARDVWPDNAEREVTFIYSACGCPVKVMVRRTGERTVRTKELPVIFPDDPPVVSLITRLMGW